MLTPTFDDQDAWGLVTVTCPWCQHREACCRCGGSRKVVYDVSAIAGNAWDVKGCDCQTCTRLRVMRAATLPAEEVAPPPTRPVTKLSGSAQWKFRNS